MDEQHKDEHEDELDPEELEQQDGEPLPDREVMSVVNPGDQFLGGPMPDPTIPYDPPITE